MDSGETLVALLGLVDKVLIASLVIMVIIGGYESTVSKLNIQEEDRKVSWLGKLDSTGIKVKLALAIVAICSVHLLRIFMNIDVILTAHSNGTTEIFWTIMVHITVVLSAVLMATMENINKRNNKDH